MEGNISKIMLVWSLDSFILCSENNINQKVVLKIKQKEKFALAYELVFYYGIDGWRIFLKLQVKDLMLNFSMESHSTSCLSSKIIGHKTFHCQQL